MLGKGCQHGTWYPYQTVGIVRQLGRNDEAVQTARGNFARIDHQFDADRSHRTTRSIGDSSDPGTVDGADEIAVQRPRLPKALRAQLRAELQAGARVCDLCHKYALPRDTVNNIRRELSDSKKNS